MESIKGDDLLRQIDRFRGKTIAVIGDLMLDRYIWGTVDRISPEAPVPVVEVESETTSLGGASNVANNIHSLKAEAIPIGVIGADHYGDALLQEIEKAKFRTEGIFRVDGRRTTVKTRVIAHSQHVVRVDYETKGPIEGETEKRILDYFESLLPELDAVVLEDYNKGLLTPSLLGKIIKKAKKRDVLVTADPKQDNFFAFKGVDVFKPNRRETEQAFGRSYRSLEELAQAANELRKRLSCNNVLITLGEDGMLLMLPDRKWHHIPTRALKVHDVSGAGDTVIGTLTTALASGASVQIAATLANYAAGVVVGEVGAVPITPEKLRETILYHNAGKNR